MMTIFLFSVNCRSVLFCVLTVFNAGPSQCVTREVGITITDNRWPWNAVYENRESIEFKMLQSNLTSAVSLFNYSTLINFRASDRVLRRNMQQFLDIARVACGFNWAAMGRFFSWEAALHTQASMKPCCWSLHDTVIESHVRVKQCTLLEDFRNKINEYHFKVRAV